MPVNPDGQLQVYEVEFKSLQNLLGPHGEDAHGETGDSRLVHCKPVKPDGHTQL